jgi:hypothetical protein
LFRFVCILCFIELKWLFVAFVLHIVNYGDLMRIVAGVHSFTAYFFSDGSEAQFIFTF